MRWLGDVFRAWDGTSPAWLGLLGVPFDGSTVSDRRGSRHAPAKLRQHLYAKTNYSTEHHAQLTEGCVDFGDVATDVASWEETLRRLLEAGTAVFGKAQHVVALGGDHSLTYGLVRSAQAQAASQALGLVQFDAHHDTRTRWGQHSGYWLRQLVDEGLVHGEHVVQVGVRGELYSREYAEYLAAHQVRYITPWALRERGLEHTLADILERLQACPVVYLTFDIDAIDQSEAPGTDYPTPGGLTAWEALYLVHRLARTGRIRWMDLMEVSPPHDIADHTAKLGAELVAQALFGLVVAKAAG